MREQRPFIPYVLVLTIIGCTPEYVDCFPSGPDISGIVDFTSDATEVTIETKLVVRKYASLEGQLDPDLNNPDDLQITRQIESNPPWDFLLPGNMTQEREVQNWSLEAWITNNPQPTEALSGEIKGTVQLSIGAERCLGDDDYVYYGEDVTNLVILIE